MKPLEIKIKVWEAEYEKLLSAIAQLEFRLETLKGIPDGEQVGEKQTGPTIGGKAGFVKVTCKELREDTQKELEQKLNMQRALEVCLRSTL